MKIYVASRFKNANLVKAFSVKLATIKPDWECIQTWTDEVTNPRPGWLAAQQDLKELDEADAIVVMTQDCELVPGGMHFETGYAYAKGKLVFIIGPVVNVFHEIPSMQHFADPAAFFAWVIRFHLAERGRL